MPCERKQLKILWGLANEMRVPAAEHSSLACAIVDEMFVELRKALAACDESPWRSMESAPKDGTEVDLTDGTDRCTDCLWSDKKDAWVYWGPDDWDSFGWVKIDFVPKGWMPLPAAPDGEKP